MKLDQRVLEQIDERIAMQLRYTKVDEYNQGLYNGMVYIRSLLDSVKSPEYVDKKGTLIVTTEVLDALAGTVVNETN